MSSLSPANPLHTASAPYLLEKVVPSPSFESIPAVNNNSTISLTMLEHTKKTREECVFKHFVCTEMFANQ
jgi:hypothetical protein